MSTYLELGKKVLLELENHGFEAFFVGGVVRDYLLGIPLHDVDITTSAKPEDIERIFPKTYNVGKKFVKYL